MGLKSLPILNKVKDYNHWNSLYDSNLNYNKYFYLVLFLNNFFKYFFKDYTLIYTYKNLSKINFKGVKSNVNFNQFNLLLGNFYILKYQKWLIIVLSMYNLETKNFSIENKNNYNKVFGIKSKISKLLYKNYKYVI